MAAAMSMPVLMPAALAKRHRKKHAKARTGCLTCKIRKKKCGEEKPKCLRCTATGRICDGYADVVSLNKQSGSVVKVAEYKFIYSSSVGGDEDCKSEEGASQALISTKHTSAQSLQTLPVIPRWPVDSLFATDTDFHCFEFFRLNTGPEFSGHFDSSFWRRLLIQQCLTSPTVRQAAIALGAVHRRHKLGITPAAMEYCGIALKAYTKALRALSDEMERNDSEVFETAMASSMLLSAFEAFQDEYASSLQHTQNGLKVTFARKYHRLASRTRKIDKRFSLEALKSLFDELQVKARFLLQLDHREACSPSAGWPRPDMPSAFCDLEEAQDCLFAHVQEMFDVSTPEASANSSRDAEAKWQQHAVRLIQWSTAYANCSRAIQDHQVSFVAGTPFSLLRLCYEAAFLLLWSQLGCLSESARTSQPHSAAGLAVCLSSTERAASLDTQFGRLLFLAETIYHDLGQHTPSHLLRFWHNHNLPELAHSWCVDTGLMKPSVAMLLSPTNAFLSRSGKIRHQALMLPGVEAQLRATSFWQDAGLYSIAENIMAMEGSMGEQGLKSGFFRHGTPKWVNITCFIEERRLLILAASETQDDERELLWTQEWYGW